MLCDSSGELTCARDPRCDPGPRADLHEGHRADDVLDQGEHHPAGALSPGRVKVRKESRSADSCTTRCYTV